MTSPPNAAEGAVGENGMRRGPVTGQNGWTVVGFEEVIRGDPVALLSCCLVVGCGWQVWRGRLSERLTRSLLPVGRCGELCPL